MGRGAQTRSDGPDNESSYAALAGGSANTE